MANASLYNKGFLTTIPNTPKFATKVENGKLILNDGSIGSKIQTNKYTPNLYSDILAKTKETSKIGPASMQTPESIQAGQAVKKGPVSYQVPEVIQQAQKVTGQTAKLGTQTQASEGGDYLRELQTDIQKGIPLSEVSKLYPELGGDETLINQLYTDLKAGMPLSEIPNLYPELGQEKEQGFLSGVAEKTGESFMGGVKRIGEAGVGLAEGKYSVGEAFARGGAGALQSAFSPITGIVGETLQTGIEKIPEDIRIKIKQEANPTIEGVKEWYNSQSPEQKRRLDNIGVGVELLSNLVGAKGVQKVAPKITPAFKSTGKTIVKGGKNIIKKTGEVKQSLKATKEQITSGLTKEQIKGFQSNPYQADEFAKLTKRLESPEGISDVKDYKVERVGAITKELTDEIDKIRSTKGETSQVYKQVRQQPVQVKTDTLMNEFKQTIQDNGMTIKKGNIERVAGSKAKDLNQSDISKFNQLLKDIKADSKKGYLTPDEILTFRKTASDLAKYDASSTTTGQGIMKSLRKNIDNTAKEQIPGLKELDSQFVDKLDEFENAIKDLVYKGGDVKGEWRSNIVNIVGTLDRANRAKLLSRLDEVIPGVGERIQAIDNLPTILKSLESKGIFEKYTGVGGAIAGATALGSTLPVIGHIAGAIIGGTGGKLLESGLTGLRKVALTKVLNKVSTEGLKRMKEINTKIAKRQLLREEDKTFINSLKQQFKNEIDKSKDNNLKPITSKSMNNMSSTNPNNTTSKKLIPLNKKIEELKK